MANGIYKILTFADPHAKSKHGTAGAVEDTTDKGTANAARRILLDMPFIACFCALATMYFMVQSANHHAFARDFEMASSKVQDAFYYETHMKTYALREVSSTAATMIGAGKIKQPRKLIKNLQDIDDASLGIFQEKSNAIRQLARIEQLTLHPLALDYSPQQAEQTCPQGGMLRKEAARVIQESGNPVISDAWARRGEEKNMIKTTIFYPIRMGEEEGATPIGAVAADVIWADFFSPATLEGKEGLTIAVENTLGQNFTFVVKEGKLDFVSFGVVYDEYFEDDVVTSTFSDFDLPTGKNAVEDSNMTTAEAGVSDSTDAWIRNDLQRKPELTSFPSLLPQYFSIVATNTGSISIPPTKCMTTMRPHGPVCSSVGPF